MPTMDWFETLTGFRETDYATTRSKLQVESDQLLSTVNGLRYGIGSLELVSLQTLRQRLQTAGSVTGRLQVRVVRGDVRRLHQQPQYAGALFQVASQFNLLEMTGPDISPAHGVTRYENDATQGPACAIAAGAATIWRNYFAPVAGGDSVAGTVGQTRTHQLDGLADLGKVLGQALGRPVGDLWEMRNGYALCRQSGLQAIAAYLTSAAPETIETLAGHLRIGIHSDVEVTDRQDGTQSRGEAAPQVSQAFCSALPVAYSQVPQADWRCFAALVLQAAYEATLWAGVLNCQRGRSNIVLLTRLGGGAFGNADEWIHTAMRRALQKAAGYALDVRLVSYDTPSRQLQELVREFA